MTTINTAIQSIIDRVQTSVASASPNDVLYLAKALEATGPTSTLSQFATAVQTALTDINTAKQTAIDSLATSMTYAWAVKTANYTAVKGNYIAADTSAGAFTVTLPATPAANDFVVVADVASSFATNNLTVARNGSSIMGVADDFLIDIKNASIRFTYINATYGWRII